MAYFYENKKEQTPSWEEIGGFNARLLMEIRSAMLDVRSETGSGPVTPVAVAEWMRKHPLFEFPDDEIG